MYYFYLTLAATIIVPVMIGLLKFSHIQKPHKVLVMMLALGVITEATLVTIAFQGHQNVYVLHFHTIPELLLLLWFFRIELNSKKVKHILTAYGAFISVFSLWYAFQDNNLNLHPSIPRAMEATLVIIGCLMLFYQIATHGPGFDPLYNSTFLLTGGLLLYYSASFVSWLLIRYYITDQGTASSLWSAHCYINAFCNLFYAFALWMPYRRLSQAS